MGYLVASVVILAVVSILNLSLTLLIIQRLRGNGTSERSLPSSGPPVGSAVPDFTVTSIDGTVISRATLTRGQPTLLTFLATGCPACLPSVPHLLAHLDQAGLDASRAIVIVTGDENQQEASDIVKAVGAAATVAIEPSDGPTARALSVTHFPTFIFVDGDGAVEQTQLGAGPLRRKVAA